MDFFIDRFIHPEEGDGVKVIYCGYHYFKSNP